MLCRCRGVLTPTFKTFRSLSSMMTPAASSRSSAWTSAPVLAPTHPPSTAAAVHHALAGRCSSGQTLLVCMGNTSSTCNALCNPLSCAAARSVPGELQLSLCMLCSPPGSSTGSSSSSVQSGNSSRNNLFWLDTALEATWLRYAPEAQLLCGHQSGDITCSVSCCISNNALRTCKPDKTHRMLGHALTDTRRRVCSASGRKHRAVTDL